MKAVKMTDYFRNVAKALLALGTVSAQIWTPIVAATITVNSTSDGGAGSLRQAIQNAAPGDTINFSVTGVITLTSGELLIAENLSIVGPGASSLAVSGLSNSRVLEISSNVSVSISALTIRDGHATDGALSGASGEDGGGIYNAGTLTLMNCVVSNNTAGNGHGYVSGFGLSGGAGGFGGGIYNAGTLTLTSCTVSGNAAGAGGPSAQAFWPVGGAGGLGGGIYNAGMLALGSSCVSSNAGGAGGNGGSVGGPGGGGGGVYNAGNLRITECTLSSNIGGLGGKGGTRVRLFTSDGEPGGSGGDGAGVYNNGSLTLIACTLSGNAAGAGGLGGYGLARGGVGGNGGNGGGVCSAAGAAVAIVRSSLAALDQAGAAGVGGRAGAQGHGVQAASGSSGLGPDLYGAFTSQGHNLLGQADGSTRLTNGVNGDLVGSADHPLNPKIGRLQNNGGPTLTMALQNRSPALEAGDDGLLRAPFNLSTDQRGLPRKSGTHVDIGAFEFQVAPQPTQAQSQIIGMKCLPNGQFRLTVVTWPETTVRIEASSDLHTWTAMTDFTTAVDGSYEFIDVSAPLYPQRFYRVVTP